MLRSKTTSKKRYEKLAEYFTVIDVTDSIITLKVNIQNLKYIGIADTFLTVPDAEIGDTITVKRGPKHIAKLQIAGEPLEFNWGYIGSDKLNTRFTYIRRALVEAIKIAGINIEVQTLEVPIEVRLKQDKDAADATVISIYSEKVEQQHIPNRFTCLADAEEFKSQLENNKQLDYVSEELLTDLKNNHTELLYPDGYQTPEQRAANKQKAFEEQMKRLTPDFTKSQDADVLAEQKEKEREARLKAERKADAEFKKNKPKTEAQKQKQAELDKFLAGYVGLFSKNK